MITPEIEKEYEIFYGKKARATGKAEDIVLFTDNLAKKLGYEKAYELLEISDEDYIQAKQFLEQCKDSSSE